MSQSHIDEYAPFWFWGGWQIEKPIGEGSFGQVFRIVHEDAGQIERAVVKIISIPTAGQAEQARRRYGEDSEAIKTYFEKLAESIESALRTLHSLSGELNILSYQDILVAHRLGGAGWDILTRMEDATSLTHFLTDHPMRRGDIVWLGMDLCMTLDECLTYGVTHGDIKENNIFFTLDGFCKLADFGLSKRMAAAEPEAFLDSSKATMAPELFRRLRSGAFRDSYLEGKDASADIYSLGMVLYKLLNHGRLPFLAPYPQPIREGDVQPAIHQRLDGAPLPMPDQAGEHLGRIILKACAFDPRDRYSSASAMKQDLEKALQGLSETQRNERLTLPFIISGEKTRHETAPSPVTVKPLPKAALPAAAASAIPLTVKPVHVKADRDIEPYSPPVFESYEDDHKRSILWTIITVILIVGILLTASLFIAPNWISRLFVSLFAGGERDPGATTKSPTTTTILATPTPVPTTAPVVIVTIIPIPTPAITSTNTGLPIATPTPVPTLVTKTTAKPTPKPTPTRRPTATPTPTDTPSPVPTGIEPSPVPTGIEPSLPPPDTPPAEP